MAVAKKKATVSNRMDFAPPDIPADIQQQAAGTPGFSWTNPNTNRTYKLINSRWQTVDDPSNEPTGAPKGRPPGISKEAGQGAQSSQVSKEINLMDKLFANPGDADLYLSKDPDGSLLGGLEGLAKQIDSKDGGINSGRGGVDLSDPKAILDRLESDPDFLKQLTAIAHKMDGPGGDPMDISNPEAFMRGFEEDPEKALAMAGMEAELMDSGRKFTSPYEESIFKLAMGMDDDRSPELIAAQDAILAKSLSKKEDLNLVLGLAQADGADRENAMGLIAWLGGNYDKISKSLRDPNSLEEQDLQYGQAATYRAVQALQQLPAYTRGQLEDVAGIDGILGEPGRMIRSISQTTDLGAEMSPEDIERRLAPYKRAMESGQPFREPGFVAASGFRDGEENFARGSNISFIIQALEGNGQGRVVDQYKNDMAEGEVLWGPNMGLFDVQDIKGKPDPYSFTDFPLFGEGELSPEELGALPEAVRNGFDGRREPTSEEFYWLRDIVDLDDGMFDPDDAEDQAYLAETGLDKITPEMRKKMVNKYLTYSNPNVLDPTRHTTTVYMKELPQDIPARGKKKSPKPEEQ